MLIQEIEAMNATTWGMDGRASEQGRYETNAQGGQKHYGDGKNGFLNLVFFLFNPALVHSIVKRTGVVWQT